MSDLNLAMIGNCNIAALLDSRARVVWLFFRQWLPGPAGACLLAAGGLWVLSALCDKLHLFPNQHHFVEELLETNASILMLGAAGHHWADVLRGRRKCSKKR